MCLWVKTYGTFYCSPKRPFVCPPSQPGFDLQLWACELFCRVLLWNLLKWFSSVRALGGSGARWHGGRGFVSSWVAWHWRMRRWRKLRRVNTHCSKFRDSSRWWQDTMDIFCSVVSLFSIYHHSPLPLSWTYLPQLIFLRSPKNIWTGETGFWWVSRTRGRNRDMWKETHLEIVLLLSCQLPIIFSFGIGNW